MSCAEDNECQNGGTCEETVAGQVCLCAPGFLGTLCESHCPIKCENGGQCEIESDEHGLSMEATYICKCPVSDLGQAMYRGALCATPTTTTTTTTPAPRPVATRRPTTSPTAQPRDAPFTPKPSPSPAPDRQPALSSSAADKSSGGSNNTTNMDSTLALALGLLGSVVVVSAFITLLIVRRNRSYAQKNREPTESKEADVEGDVVVTPAGVQDAEHQQELALQVEGRRIT